MTGRSGAARNGLESLREVIASNFGLGNPPGAERVVLWDGFDQLEKERAVAFYSDKAWPDVLSHLNALRNNPTAGADYQLEEGSVLSREALPYYLRAHLEYLIQTVAESECDEGFVCCLFSQLYQVIYMHKGSPFSPVQTQLLERIAQTVAAAIDGQEIFSDSAQDIKDQAFTFVAELHTTAGQIAESTR